MTNSKIGAETEIKYPALHKGGHLVPGCKCAPCEKKREPEQTLKQRIQLRHVVLVPCRFTHGAIECPKPGSIVEIPAFDSRVARFRSLLRKAAQIFLDWFGPLSCLVAVFILGYQLGVAHIRTELAKYHPSQYFEHPGLLSADEQQRMDNAFEQIRREVSK